MKFSIYPTVIITTERNSYSHSWRGNGRREWSLSEELMRNHIFLAINFRSDVEISRATPHFEPSTPNLALGTSKKPFAIHGYTVT